MKRIKFYLIIPVLIVTMSFVVTQSWYVLTLKKYGCKMEFPVKPTQKDQKLNSAVGKLKMDMYTYEPAAQSMDANLVYLFNYTEYPSSEVNSSDKEALDTFFNNAINGAVGAVKGKLISKKDTPIGKYPGREAKIDYQDGIAIITMRLYLVENKLYMLETIAETKKDQNASITKFMNSFTLISE
jgi:hypothetical protein